VTIRLGLLAASRIAQQAVIDPTPDVDGVELVGVAARERARAVEWAQKWSLPLAFGSYREMIDSDEVDAVYIAVPASMHREWAIAAIRAGKHVLCEKPFAANADDARLIADAANASAVIVMEAFHWRYHPMTVQIREVIDSGVLGRIDRIDARFDIQDGIISRSDIRWDLALGGGALMDLGCYPVQWVRFAAGADPDVVSAVAECPVDEIDGRLEAELRWPSGVTGSIHTSMIAPDGGVVTNLIVRGELGTMTAINPLAPQNGASIVVETGDQRSELDVATSSTYFHQLIAFRDAIVDGTPFPTTADDGVRNMELIDACYRAAGLQPRPSMI
jgi:predicted dehydrogenase